MARVTDPPSKPQGTPRERALHELASRYEERLADREVVVSVFGRTRRNGPWSPPEETRAIAGFADVVLDFTHAELPAGITDVEAWAVFGNVEIHVPADLEVEFSGIALLGNLVHRQGGGEARQGLRRWLRVPGRKPAPRPARRDAEAVLCIRGTAFFGSVLVRVV